MAVQPLDRLGRNRCGQVVSLTIAHALGGSPTPLASGDIACSDFWGNDAGDWAGCIAAFAHLNGNFSADPLFCDPAMMDFGLDAASPAAPAHSGGCGLIGAFEVGCGVVSVEPTSWGRVKSAFR